jgi:hypothetical protein
MEAYDKKQTKRKRDREAVADGTATVEQQNAREVVLRNHRDFHHLEAMLRSMQILDPEAYAEVSGTRARGSPSVTPATTTVLLSREGQKFTPDPPPPCMQVPDYYKNGLHAQEQFNHFRAGRTQDRVQARLQLLATSDMPFRPYSDGEFEDLKAECGPKVEALFAANRLVRARARHCVAGTERHADARFSALHRRYQARRRGVRQRSLSLGS